MNNHEDIEVINYNKALLDNITNLYLNVVGEHFHWGMFLDKNDTLFTAQCNVIDYLLTLINTNKNTRLLDVGCGIGSTTFYIGNKYNFNIVGISNSEVGIESAKSKITPGSNNIQFYLRNALDNKFEDESFDATILIESAYMIPDKEALLKENLRVLKNNGTLLICDNMLNRALSFNEVLLHMDKIKASKSIFGEASYLSYQEYKDLALSVGYKSVEIYDIKEQVYPTISHVLKNIEENYHKLAQLFSADDIEKFKKSFQLSQFVYDEGLSTYGIIKAIK